jgi:hypothetical protein
LVQKSCAMYARGQVYEGGPPPPGPHSDATNYKEKISSQLGPKGRTYGGA